MAINYNNVIVDGIDMVTVFDQSTDKVLAMLDEITEGNLENGVEQVYVTGKRGSRLATLNRNKTCTFTCTNAYLVAGALALQTGTDAEYASEESKLLVPYYEMVKLSDPTTMVLTHTPVGVDGAEVKFVYPIGVDGTQGEPLTVDSEPSEGKFKCEAGSKTLTFNAGQFERGDLVLVFYDYEDAEGVKYANNADTFAQSGKVIIDVTCRDVCNQSLTYHGRFVIPNASIDGNFALSFSNEAATHPFGCEALAPVCKADKNLWEFYIVA